ncbi:hypothetical protein NECAME_16349, partial [Necator americanus]
MVFTNNLIFNFCRSTIILQRKFRSSYLPCSRPLQYLQCLNLHECLRYPSFRSDLISEMKAEYMEDEWSLPRLNSQHQESSYV